MVHHKLDQELELEESVHCAEQVGQESHGCETLHEHTAQSAHGHVSSPQMDPDQQHAPDEESFSMTSSACGNFVSYGEARHNMSMGNDTKPMEPGPDNISSVGNGSDNATLSVVLSKRSHSVDRLSSCLSQVTDEHAGAGANSIQGSSRSPTERPMDGYIDQDTDADPETTFSQSVQPTVSQALVVQEENAVRSQAYHVASYEEHHPGDKAIKVTEYGKADGVASDGDGDGLIQITPRVGRVEETDRGDSMRATPDIPWEGAISGEVSVDGNGVGKEAKAGLHAQETEPTENQDDGSAVNTRLPTERATSGDAGPTEEPRYTDRLEPDFHENETAQAGLPDEERGEDYTFLKQPFAQKTCATDTADIPTTRSPGDKPTVAVDCARDEENDREYDVKEDLSMMTPTEGAPAESRCREDGLLEDDATIEEKPPSDIFVDSERVTITDVPVVAEQQKSSSGSEGLPGSTASALPTESDVAIGPEASERLQNDARPLSSASSNPRQRQRPPNISYNYLDSKAKGGQGSEGSSYVYFSNMLRFSRTGFVFSTYSPS